MSKLKVVSIVMWSIVAIALIAVLVISSRGGFPWSWNWDENYDYVVQEKTFNADNIKNIDVDTLGRAEFYKSEGNEIKIIEKSVKEKDNEESKINGDGETLRIESEKKHVGFSFLWFGNQPTKFEIYLPEKEYNNVKLKTTSGGVKLSKIHANEVEIKSTSGDITAEEVIANNNIQIDITSGSLDFGHIESKELNVKMTSGDVEVGGKAERVNAKLTSGRITLDFDEQPQSMKTDQTSGDIRITIPENDGFSYSYNLTSGDFKSDFNINTSGRSGSGDYKNGGPDYQFKTTSGQVELRKK